MLADHLGVLEGRIGIGLERAHMLWELPALKLHLTSASFLLFQAALRVELAASYEHVIDRNISTVDFSVNVTLTYLRIFFIRVGGFKSVRLILSPGPSVSVAIDLLEEL